MCVTITFTTHAPNTHCMPGAGLGTVAGTEKTLRPPPGRDGCPVEEGDTRQVSKYRAGKHVLFLKPLPNGGGVSRDEYLNVHLFSGTDIKGEAKWPPLLLGALPRTVPISAVWSG